MTSETICSVLKSRCLLCVAYRNKLAACGLHFHSSHAVKLRALAAGCMALTSFELSGDDASIHCCEMCSTGHHSSNIVLRQLSSQHLCIQAPVVKRITRMPRQCTACSKTPSKMKRPVHSGSVDAKMYSAGHSTLTGPRGCIYKLPLTATALLKAVLHTYH